MHVTTSPRTIRVAVADVDPFARDAMVSALSADEGIELVGLAVTPAEAVSLVRREHPDVLVMDASMPGVGAIAATAEIARDRPLARVVLLTHAADAALGVLALRAGAVGFVPKSVGDATLVRVVRDVAHGKAAISRRLTMRLIEHLRHSPSGGLGLRPIHGPLTSRQWEVIDLLAQNTSTQDIATELGLSPDTVRSHVKTILRTLGVHSRVEAVAKARELRDESVTPVAVGCNADDELRDLGRRMRPHRSDTDA